MDEIYFYVTADELREMEELKEENEGLKQKIKKLKEKSRVELEKWRRDYFREKDGFYASNKVCAKKL